MTNNLRKEMTWGWTPSVNWPQLCIHVGISGAVTSLLRQVTKGWYIIAPIERYIPGRDIFNTKRKCCNHRCRDSVYFHTLFFIIYLSAIETLICRREMSLKGSTSFGFAQNTIHDLKILYRTHCGIVFDKCHKKWPCRRLNQRPLLSGSARYRLSYVRGLSREK